MAIYYVKSTATGTADGSSWVNAFTTLAAAAAVDVAGDTIYVSHLHSESTAASVTLAFAGNLAQPTYIICVDDGAIPPTATANTAVMTTTGASAITISGVVYASGVTFNQGTGIGTGGITVSSLAGSMTTLESCVLRRVSTAVTAIAIGSSAGTSYGIGSVFKNCEIYFSNSGQNGVTCDGAVLIKGGGVQAGSFTPSAGVFNPSNKCTALEIDGFDFSAFSATVSPFKTTSSGAPAACRMINCKMPASWSGALYAGTINVLGQTFALYNCDSGDTNYRLWLESYAGAVRDETTVVRTGGASDGTTPLAWRMASSANANALVSSLESPEMVVWNDTTGAAKTVTVEVLTDGVTLTDADCWLEVQYLGTAGFPLGSFITDAKADVLATAADQATSAETWTTTGLTTPVKQKLSVTFTPQEKGFVHAKVMLAKPSTTVYVCPKASVT